MLFILNISSFLKAIFKQYKQFHIDFHLQVCGWKAESEKTKIKTTVSRQWPKLSLVSYFSPHFLELIQRCLEDANLCYVRDKLRFVIHIWGTRLLVWGLLVCVGWITGWWTQCAENSEVLLVWFQLWYRLDVNTWVPHSASLHISITQAQKTDQELL